MAALGLFVVAVAVANLFSRSYVSLVMRRRRSFWSLAGLTGVISGAFGTPGPAAVPYFVGQTIHAETAKANLQIFFTLVAAPVIVFHAAAGNMTFVALGRAGLFVPLVMLVTLTGTRAAELLPAETLRRVVDIGLIALGAYILFEQLIA